MLEPKQKLTDEEAATRIYPDMPNYVGTEAEFLAAVDVGLADLDAGRTISSKDLAAMDPSDEPPSFSQTELQAMLDESRADVEAGRTVPLETVLAELRASVAHMKHRRPAKAHDAA